METNNGALRVPRHVAVIMDGNGRWARARNKERLEGHRAGAESVHRVIEACVEKKIKYLTLFSFSTENWKRSRAEVMGLMGLFSERLRQEQTEGTLQKNGVRLRSIGDLGRLPLGVRTLLKDVEARTAENDTLQVVLALSYGGRQEIVQAARKIATAVKAKKLAPSEITEELFARNLWTSDLPDPDLLIRTGGEFRVSNFLLWQLAYSELVVVQDFWPDFSKEIFEGCLTEFGRRERRFGMTSEQVRNSSGDDDLAVDDGTSAAQSDNSGG